MRSILLTRSTYLILVILVSFFAQIFLPMSKGYINVNQYCRAFDDNFKPLICIIKNGSNSNSHSPGNYNPPQTTPPPPPPPPHYHPTSYPILQPMSPEDIVIDFEDEDDDEECSCEIKCVPRVTHTHNRYVGNRHRRKRSPPSASYRCRSCGTECDVSTTRPPMCYCVIPATKAECNCSATCASFRGNPFYYQPHDDDDEDANCIISIKSLEDWRLDEEKAPYSCECRRSKEAQNTRRPHFICVCQRVPTDD